MNRRPDIVLVGRKRGDDDRSLSLYEYKIDESDVIFEYEFSDWIDTTSYFVLYDNEVYFNRDAPELDKSNKVANYSRDHAYSNDEIRKAIEDYLIEKLLLAEAK